MFARIVLLLLLWPAAAVAEIRVLFIGNSLTYTNDLPRVVERLAASRGIAVKTTFAGEGGADLKRLWAGGSALAAIRSRRWDWVVLQDQSSAPIYEPDELPEYARRFDAEIRARGGKTLLFMTWAYKSAPHMQPAITRVYERAGASAHVAVAPVGVVWDQLRGRMQLYDGSEQHPNPTGTYLAACVFFSIITGQSPVGLPHENVTAADAALIQHTVLRR